MEKILLDQVARHPSDDDFKRFLITYYSEQGDWRADAWFELLGQVPETVDYWKASDLQEGKATTITLYKWPGSRYFDTIAEAYEYMVNQFRERSLRSELKMLFDDFYIGDHANPDNYRSVGDLYHELGNKGYDLWYRTASGLESGDIRITGVLSNKHLLEMNIQIHSDHMSIGCFTISQCMMSLVKEYADYVRIQNVSNPSH